MIRNNRFERKEKKSKEKGRHYCSSNYLIKYISFQIQRAQGLSISHRVLSMVI